ncbi:alpha/beta fold hydrolase [Anoxynatronum buryatiense]|uniref:Pimeloyl-ACP methyl ester carboxylesterase n=1 Tax=Anoxynatronum buryatiense TaxID=489973 RepID=A0AA45WXW3_9CLOT|nr:alpha/beta hydrolase [Anoxynatronum buryatiense]SMP65960.1 Pimeloyl-ACP methyl ester carboxylesterase [Anoxynatronum buryatiense]
MRITTSKDGTKLAYDVEGSGSPLIYITGATCFRKFKPIEKDVKVFASKFTVYSYDRRGRGDSGNTLPYSSEREIEDIEAMIDAAGGQAYLYGHSSGAILALEAAMRLKHKVLKVILYDLPYVHDDEEADEFRRLGLRIEALLENKEHSAAIKAFLHGIGMPKAFSLLLPLFPGWKTMKELAPTLAYDIFIAKDYPPIEKVAQINIPVFIITGEKSPAGMREVNSKVAEAIPNAEFTLLKGQDHMVDARALLPIFTTYFA